MGLQDKRTAGRTEQWDLWGERLVILKRESGQKAAEGADAAEERNSGWDESRGKGCGRQSPGQSPSAWCSCHVESPPTLTGLTSPGGSDGNDAVPAIRGEVTDRGTSAQHSFRSLTLRKHSCSSLRRNPPSKEQGRPAKSRHNLPPREQVALGGDPLSPVKLGATAARMHSYNPIWGLNPVKLSEFLTHKNCGGIVLSCWIWG